MKEETGFFTSFKGTRLFFRSLDGDFSSALIIVHGFGEHSGRYENLISALKGLPISIFLFDLRGHGQSEGERVCIDSFDDLVEDVYHFRRFVEDKSPKAKNFILYGQSFGGLIAAASALRNQDAWKALVLLAPFFGLPFGGLFLAVLTSCLNAVISRQVWANPIKPVFLTHDPDELALYKRDPLIQRRIGICLANEMFKAGHAVAKRARELMLPLLVLAAGDDRIVSTPKIKMFFEEVSSKEKEIHVFDGFYHELFHELGRDRPLNVLKGFVQKHLE